MGNLKFGTNSPLALYMGVSGSTKAYYGTTVVYEGGGKDYSKEYLTLEVLTGGTISWIAFNNEAVAKTISYSLDNGQTWTVITSTLEGTEINVSAGDKVIFKGNTRGTGSGVTDTSAYNSIRGTAYFDLSGNIDSIADADNFRSGVTLTQTYKGLFRGANVVDASNLYLPSPTVNFQYRFLFRDCQYLIELPSMTHFTPTPQNCCRGMFSNCISIEKATNLPIIDDTYTNYQLADLFNGCTNLDYVVNLSIRTSSSSSSATYNWLAGVAASGTFVKNANMTSWQSGASGIPSGWTVIDA